MDRKLKNEELNRPSVDRFKLQKKYPIVVVLDNIRSLNNIGSVFRTSDAFAVESIQLCGISAKPPHREIQKTALGSTESVHWEYHESTLDCLESLKSKGFQCYAIEQTESSQFLNEFAPKSKQKLALVFGHEVKGVSQEVVNYCDGVIEIPQEGTKHSLNISISVGVVLWDLINKIKHAAN